MAATNPAFTPISTPTLPYIPNYSYTSAYQLPQPFVWRRRELTQDEHAAIVQAFNRFGSLKALGENVTLNRKQLGLGVLAVLGTKPTKLELENVLPTITHEDGTLHHGTMDLAKFVELMTFKLTSRSTDEEIRQIFVALDTGCTGFVTVSDLHRILKEICSSIPHHIVQQMFKEIDQDMDGRVSFRDFERLMKHSVQ